MKTINKIFLIFAMICGLSIFINEVMAVGNIYQSWINVNESNERYLLYRNYTAPSNVTLKDYTNVHIYDSNETIPGQTYLSYNGTYKQSNWVYLQETFGAEGTLANLPKDVANLKTVGMIFHRYQIGRYESRQAPNMSTYDMDDEITAYTSTLGKVTQDFSDIKYAYDNSYAVYVEPFNSNSLTSPLFEDNNNIILEQRTTDGVILNGVNPYGNGIIITPEAGKSYISSLADQEVEYRYAIIGTYDNGTFKDNIYVRDNIIKERDVDTLIKNLQGNLTCYVSSSVAALTYSPEYYKKPLGTGGYEVAKSAKNFFSTYPYNNAQMWANWNIDQSYISGAGYEWTTAVKGLVEGTKAMGSILNYYDNIIEFPQMTERKVVVRHINIGNNTELSKNVIKNATRLTGGNKTLTLSNPTSTITSETVPTGIDGQEYYTSIKVEQGITKTALSDTITYKCIGYNVQVANSYSEAEKNLSKAIETNNYNVFYGSNRSVYVSGNSSVTADDDYIIIDFYYSEYDKDVYVNHVYLDKNGVVLDISEQTIQSNKQAIMGGTSIDNKSTILYEERYAKKLSYDITTKIAESLQSDLNKGEALFYLGYEAFNSKKDINQLVGSQISVSSNNTSNQVRISGDIVQVNYYYYIDHQYIQDAPTRTIGGKVFANLTGSNQIEGACTDTETGFRVKSIPSETQLKLGITDIPKGMVSGITTEAVKNVNMIGIDLNIATGTRYRSVSYNNLEYSVGYYKITNVLLHKLRQTIIYDADTTEVETVGNTLFDSWQGNKITIKPNNIELKLELVGINGNVSNTTANINNENNYVKVYLTDKYGNIGNLSNGRITMNYVNNSAITQTEYQSLLSQSDTRILAQTLGLNLVIEVQNMTVKIDGETINSSNNKVIKTISLSDYLQSDTTVNVYTNVPSFQKAKYQSLGTITASNYNNLNKIDTSILNGIRTIAGKVEYTAEFVIGDKNQTTITDTVYYSDRSTNRETVVFEANTQSITKVYEVNKEATNSTDKYKDVALLNIYTPITVTTSFKSENNIAVDQTENIQFSTNTIQINSPFTITLDNAERVDMYDIDSTKKYSGGYYIKFDFDVHQVKLNGITYKNGNKISANTWIGPIYRNKSDKASITAQAYADFEGGNNIVSETSSSYTVRAVAYNITDLMKTESLKYATIDDMLAYNETLKDFMNNICDISSYFSETKEEVAVVNRLYDFRITDLQDLSWKSVFRKSSGNTTNVHTGNLYYSGTTKWNINSEKANHIISRTSSEIGRNPLRTLPLGPYKNTDSTYIKAPKLGYRFSFDMKVTGLYSTNKKIKITTSFYYISKDGKTFIEEYTGNKEGIYLFYKNSAGKYVRIDESTGGGYNLTFIPNDGYRYIEDTNKSTLATSLVTLGNLRNMTLTHKMATVSNTEFYVTYYGEYKLPNSTIAVKVNKDGTYNINEPLEDGYIGVIFDITAYSGKVVSNGKTQDISLLYSKDTNGTNTSQWDCEGFLGYTKYGSKVIDNTLSIRLEKGKWNITNDIYNKIKGSVILYDVDERAATDYE